MKLVQLASVANLIKTSYRLWRHPAARGAGLAAAFFLLTLINPKGLLVVSFIVPVQTFTDLTLYLNFSVQFCVVVIPVGCSWVLFGARIKHSGHAWLTPLNINRTASAIICCFAVAILSRLTDSLIKVSATL
ncbi:hypothetical protein SAMN05216600_101401 [Pseudomonas cuatrocienegasensis]|uniref:LysE type translocator n=1 Tax=Pseudomonas cuatrocienegasensis TaxID=543360 RepID=A0ABY1B1W0_9PSED|nr:MULTISPECIES: hypothetical protein [Pseudomonas]SEP71664.1 hypothetical protein SAMN05216600_101401 [Pseudomonas cuatrocienegasensis]